MNNVSLAVDLVISENGKVDREASIASITEQLDAYIAFSSVTDDKILGIANGLLAGGTKVSGLAAIVSIQYCKENDVPMMSFAKTQNRIYEVIAANTGAHDSGLPFGVTKGAGHFLWAKATKVDIERSKAAQAKRAAEQAQPEQTSQPTPAV